MSEVTVKQLADTVGTPVDRLLKQMQEAGLAHARDDELVTDDEKQTLLAHLKASHGDSGASQPSKITLKRRTSGILKTGQGRAGRTVNVEVRRKRTYVKRAEAGAEAPAAAPAAAAETAPARQPSALELEAQRIREEELARKSAEEETRRQEAEKKAEEERRREEAARQEEEARKEAERKAAETAVAEPKPAEAAVDPAEAAKAAAEAQAKQQAAERGGKRAKAKDRERKRETGERRRELSLKTERRARRRHHQAPIQVDREGGEFRPTEFIAREVELPDAITVGDLAQRMSVKAGEVIKTLMGMGVMATINQTVDQDTATLVVEEMGHKVKLIHEDALEQSLEQSLAVEGEELSRPPVVTVMGHVDHGKTSLLDHIRKTRVVSGEAGGITQHIGAYRVDTPHGRITFIDTPGHAAFTAMRARGAQSTDIVILVVAADDGVMPQTEEAIQHARAAGVPIVVALNKIDLEGADPERVTNELAAKEVVPEDWGGDTQFIKVSAVTGEGIEELLEAILLQAEILELKAVEEGPARGVVIESRIDKGRGPVSTVLVQNGTLRQGDVVIAGEYHGRVRAMLNDLGEQVQEAGPSDPVELLGLGGTPDAGDDFSVATDERTARDLAEFRRDKSQEKRVAMQQAAKLENMFANIGEGEKRILKMVLKADVRGSLEAIQQALADMGNEEVAVNVLGSGVGGITATDANLALTYGAAIFGFNVRADNAAKKIIEREGLDLRYYSVIYELLDDVKQVLTGMLAPEIREEIIGVAEVRDVFRSPRFGQVAGCMVVEGTVHRNKPIRVLRDNVVIFEGELESLRRFKDDVNEVRNGTECGIGVRNYNDVRVGDLIEVFDSKEVAREL
ncbi:MAG: translation initiation factor IF-2 [Gammaproteobacteria bacterium]